MYGVYIMYVVVFDSALFVVVLLICRRRGAIYHCLSGVATVYGLLTCVLDTRSVYGLGAVYTVQ